MGSLGDNKTLWFECMIPTHIFYYLVVSVMAGTINFVFLTGETIEQSEGMIVNISFATRY
jgi:hypothetical protein